MLEKGFKVIKILKMFSRYLCLKENWPSYSQRFISTDNIRQNIWQKVQQIKQI